MFYLLGVLIVSVVSFLIFRHFDNKKNDTAETEETTETKKTGDGHAKEKDKEEHAGGGHDDHGSHGGSISNWKIYVRLAAFVLIIALTIYWTVLFVRHLDGPMEYPKSGKAIATMKNPVKAYLDPEKTYTQILGVGNAKYVLESDPEKFFICREKPEVLDSTRHINNWAAMPAGKYLVYPDWGYESDEGIVFKWWQKKE